MKTVLILSILFSFTWCGRAFAKNASDSNGGMGSMTGMAVVSARDSMSNISPTAKLALSVADGDSVWYVRATFTGLDSAGHAGPLANQTVHFYAQRLFGILPVRDDDNTATTDDSGHADIQMPKNIPGGTHGILTLLARVEDDAATGMIQTRDSGAWGKVVPLAADPFPRELWEPDAPIAMVVVISILFGGVWATYGFVATQLVTIKKETHHET